MVGFRKRDRVAGRITRIIADQADGDVPGMGKPHCGRARGDEK
jgi:hypothetical protein